MRFLLDENVDARVRRVFTERSHECWTVPEANLAGDTDDEVTVYAMDHHAVVVTHDVEFSKPASELPSASTSTSSVTRWTRPPFCATTSTQ